MLRLSALATLLASPAMADPEGYGHMFDGGYGYGPAMMVGPLISLLTLGLIVFAAVWAFRRLDGEPGGRKTNALAELDLRFARGEIDAEDYSARRKLLTP